MLDERINKLMQDMRTSFENVKSSQEQVERFAQSEHERSKEMLDYVKNVNEFTESLKNCQHEIASQQYDFIENANDSLNSLISELNSKSRECNEQILLQFKNQIQATSDDVIGSANSLKNEVDKFASVNNDILKELEVALQKSSMSLGEITEQFKEDVDDITNNLKDNTSDMQRELRSEIDRFTAISAPMLEKLNDITDKTVSNVDKIKREVYICQERQETTLTNISNLNTKLVESNELVKSYYSDLYYTLSNIINELNVLQTMRMNIDSKNMEIMQEISNLKEDVRVVKSQNKTLLFIVIGLLILILIKLF